MTLVFSLPLDPPQYIVMQRNAVVVFLPPSIHQVCCLPGDKKREHVLVGLAKSVVSVSCNVPI